MSNKWRFFWAVSFTLVIFFQACGSDLLPDSLEGLLVSTSDEKKMGREFDSLVRNGGKNEVMDTGEKLFVPNGTDQQALYNFYLDRGKEMVKIIDPKDINALLPSEKLCRNNNGAIRNEAVACTKDNFFEFKIIESKQMNAFAVPGGYVYFYTTIMKGNKGFQSESELMSVMGHEIGHVVLHHSRDRMVKQAGASAILGAIGGGDGGGIVGLIGLLGANFWLASNSQSDESQSDSMGFYYTNKMGISSEGLSDFFNRGLIKKPDGTCDKAANASSGDVFSTHPPSCDRVIANDKRIKTANQTPQTHPKDKNKVDGKTFTQLVRDAGI